MKRFLVLAAVVLITIAVMGAYLETARSTSFVLRSGASSSDVTLADLTWSGRPSDTRRISRRANGLVFHFTGSGSAITCSDTEIWGYSRGITAQLQWRGLTTCGTLVTDDSTYLAQTITTTDDFTATGVTLLDNGGNNRHATLRLDAAELEYWVVRFPALSSGTMNCHVTSY